MLKYVLILPVLGLLWSCGPADSQQSAEADAPAEPRPTELSIEAQQQYRQQGKRIAQATFGALSSQLMQAVKAGGVPNAIEYCNLAAYPLTDSMAQAMQAHIRRTALRYRNPQNAPTEAERRILTAFQAQMENGETPKPVVEAQGPDSVSFYAPIVLMEACLKCHGEVGEQISPDDYALIQQKYPEDQAIGFATGDLRGAWSITFARQN